jgi:predicted transcriptional regulator
MPATVGFAQLATDLERYLPMTMPLDAPLAAATAQPSTPPAAPVNDVASTARLADLADYVVPFTLRAICELRIADHLAAGPRPVAELARLTGSHELALHRALRALASRDIFTELEPGVFGLTALAEPLRSDHPASLRDAYPLLAGDIQAWAAFDYTLRTGEPAFDHVQGIGYWEYMAERPHDSALFDASQRSVTRRELRAILPAYDWSSFGTIVDVGGGNGAFLGGILDAFPSVHGILFDQPHVVTAARSVLDNLGVGDRCEVMGGDFREWAPAGGDAYLLKRVLYAWNDEQATTMLRTIRAGMHPDSRLLLIEPVLEPGNDFDWGKLYDVLLLVLAGGGGRSLDDLQALFAKADLELVRVIRTRMLPIIEVRPI